MKQYIIRFQALNPRAEGLLDKALTGVEGNMKKVCQRIGLRENEFILSYEVKGEKK